MGQHPVCPHQAPPAASGREQVRPEDGGAAPDSGDLVPQPGTARSPRTDRSPDRGPHRQVEKLRHRTWEDRASRAQRSLVPTPQPRLPPGYIHTLSEARSTHARPSAAKSREPTVTPETLPEKWRRAPATWPAPAPGISAARPQPPWRKNSCCTVATGRGPPQAQPSLGAPRGGARKAWGAQPDMQGLLLGEGQWAPPPACQVPASLSPGVPRRCWGPHWSLCSQLPSSLPGIRG